MKWIRKAFDGLVGTVGVCAGLVFAGLCVYLFLRFLMNLMPLDSDEYQDIDAEALIFFVTLLRNSSACFLAGMLLSWAFFRRSSMFWFSKKLRLSSPEQEFDD